MPSPGLDRGGLLQHAGLEGKHLERARIDDLVFRRIVSSA
jgi:hypothetical protein